VRIEDYGLIGDMQTTALGRDGTVDLLCLPRFYGIGGERRLIECDLGHRPGYEGSQPVRIGNAATEQFQLDVYGEVIAAAFLGATALGRIKPQYWPRRRRLVDHVETIWREPDDGIWASRGPAMAAANAKGMGT
jgi:GH15 family glucan-1,4-alpha-glucosidase